jgi:hypothetical protein
MNRRGFDVDISDPFLKSFCGNRSVN